MWCFNYKNLFFPCFFRFFEEPHNLKGTHFSLRAKIISYTQNITTYSRYKNKTLMRAPIRDETFDYVKLWFYIDLEPQSQLSTSAHIFSCNYISDIKKVYIIIYLRVLCGSSGRMERVKSKVIDKDRCAGFRRVVLTTRVLSVVLPPTPFW